MEQWIVYITLLGVLVFFIMGKWRYDMIALSALMFITLTGVIPQNQAFSGFGHPAVITIAAGLVASRGLQNSGVLDSLTRFVGKLGNRPSVIIGALSLITAMFSSFMSSVGAVALVMPVGMRLARKYGFSPSIVLMPLAFSSLLAGLMTLIATPPNIIIASFRENATQLGAYSMFDFTPVGLPVTLIGIAFISFIGWRLIPVRNNGQTLSGGMFRINEYLTEVYLPAHSKLVGRTISDLRAIVDVDLIILMLVRDGRRIPNPAQNRVFQAGDILIIEISPDNLTELIDVAKVELQGNEHVKEALQGTGEVTLIEAVIRPDSPIIDQTVASLHLRWKYNANLIAVARQGTRIVNNRLINVQFKPGDVLLLQGRTAALPDILERLGCIPLNDREMHVTKPRRIALGVGIFAAGILAISLGILEVQVAMVLVMLAMVLTGLVSLREVYESIEWPIIILLGSMIPIGTALETTGGAQQIADIMLSLGNNFSPVVTLIILMIITMILSDVVNNAATAVLMAPIALGIAQGFGVSPDPFLMGVAVSSACAFLTPIGHQANTLILGPGGYRFGDYWRMGLPLAAIVITTALTIILIVWPM
jgi:di/tricarboxylate transporter